MLKLLFVFPHLRMSVSLKNSCSFVSLSTTRPAMPPPDYYSGHVQQPTRTFHEQDGSEMINRSVCVTKAPRKKKPKRPATMSGLLGPRRRARCASINTNRARKAQGQAHINVKQREHTW